MRDFFEFSLFENDYDAVIFCIAADNVAAAGNNKIWNLILIKSFEQSAEFDIIFRIGNDRSL